MTFIEQFLCRNDPRDNQEIWQMPEGKKIQFQPRLVVLVVILLIPMTLTATLGTISFSTSDGTAITSFWPAAAFQIVFTIWFGIYGLLAGVIGPMFGYWLIGDSAFQFLPANIIQCAVAGFCFRYFKLDPRIKSKRDWYGLIFIACILAHVLGAGAGLIDSYLRNPELAAANSGLSFWLGKYATWIAGNTLPSIVLAPMLLKALSPMMIRGPLFCQGFFGCANFFPEHHRMHLRDMPMQAKLMMLTMGVGIFPLSIIAGFTVLDMVKSADEMTAKSTQLLVHEIRMEIERHELLLRMWSAQLNDPQLTQADRQQLLDQWNRMPETFTDLEISDLQELQRTAPKEIMDTFQDIGIMFFVQNASVKPFANDYLRAMIKLSYAPDKVLTGLTHWYQDSPLTQNHDSTVTAGMIVMDRQSLGEYRRVPPELEDWIIPEKQTNDLEYYNIEHAGQQWHVADVYLDRLGWRFIRLTSSKEGLRAILTTVPNPMALIINLAIFGSFIIGGKIASRISNRVLTIAEHLCQSGGRPVALNIPIRGRDELGYLAGTLNRISQELADNVHQLQVTTAEKERLEAEMNLARQVQLSLLPNSLPQIQGYQFAAVSHPAREVGGDFYDFIGEQNGHTILTIGDVVGKGLRAAMFATETHGLLHAATLMHKTDPAQILGSINSAIVQTQLDEINFVTMFCGVLDTAQHRLHYASAGHNPPLLIRHGDVHELQLGGLPLAVVRQEQYPLFSETLSEGDTVIMYTDGVTEAKNPADELYGVERLTAIVQQHANRTAVEIQQLILDSVTNFVDDAPQTDDITLLILQKTWINSG
ncbi:MAG: SpoIIE family protein phosphatase [Planctomycetes bacterium]|nr:SpoIIE family protein phosphatase [Planctomycetota bacterium]